jgi:ferredoxin/flavodoxin---NADP+ reductase
MTTFTVERVVNVHHWNDTLFTFNTTRDAALRFESGQFLMLGLEVDGKPLMRAYSLASAHYDERLEFFSIKVPHGALTSRLQHLRVDDPVLVGRKAHGTLLLHDLLPGRHLYLFGTGTGLAPFLSIIKDPATYERFEKVALVHGVRMKNELAYASMIEEEVPSNELVGAHVRAKLIYYPTVTREPFRNAGRLPELIKTRQLFTDIGLPPLDPAVDRVMLCGSPSMLKTMRALLDGDGFSVSPRIGERGHYVLERAFVER